jgi:mannose-6-phosphate isomerase-like protein (cupin superfamily)
MLKSTYMLCAALATLALPGLAAAQQNLTAAVNQTQNIKRIPLQKFDVPGALYETVIGIAEIAPNVAIGRHTHPGPESGYLIEGGFELLIDGDQPRQLKAGDSYVVPPNTTHDAKTGAAGAKVIATYVVEKGKPLASPAR